MIDNLLEFQDKLDRTTEFDLDGYIELVSIEQKEASLYLSFHICTGIDNEPIQVWKINCFESRAYQTKLCELCENFELLENHVLLWSYNQPRLSLTFSYSNHKLDIYHVIGKLHERHFALVNKWIPFNSCFNICKHLSLKTLIASGHGKLAEGAEEIILGYQEILDEFKIKSSYLSGTPKRWDNDLGWIDEEGDAKILMFGSSYVIASGFTAQRILN